MAKKDKRLWQRRDTVMRMVCNLAVTRPGNPEWSGWLRNGSEGGAYIETATRLEARTAVLVRIQSRRGRHGKSGQAAGIPWVFLAEVRWSKPLGGKRRDGFGAGLKFI